MKPSLYHPTILNHSQQPHHFCKPTHFTHYSEGYNPQCGDHLHVYLNVVDDMLVDISFEGEMCALCKSSASMMTTLLMNQPVKLMVNWFSLCERLLKGEENDMFGEMNVFHLITHYPARVKCVKLPWHTTKHALNGQHETTTEEN